MTSHADQLTAAIAHHESGHIAEAKAGYRSVLAAQPTHAEALQANAKRLPALFPAGTSADDMPGKSYAKADIWAKKPEFDKAAYVLEEQAEKLAEVAGAGDAAAIKVQLASLGNDGWRAEAEANRCELLGLGLWGVPCFAYNGVSAWGQDRLWVIESAIRSTQSKISGR